MARFRDMSLYIILAIYHNPKYLKYCIYHISLLLPEIARFVEGKFGKTLLLDNAGYYYRQIRKKASFVFWTCEELESDISNRRPCPARATTEGAYVVCWNGVHNHPVNEAKLQGSASSSGFGLKIRKDLK